jgi:hypothetical protein
LSFCAFTVEIIKLKKYLNKIHNKIHNLKRKKMSFLRDAGDSLVKYSEIIVNKTEEYTKIAKLMLDIKKLESDIEKNQSKLGKFVIVCLENGQSNLDLADLHVVDFFHKIKDDKVTIDAKREEINIIKQSGRSENK